MTENNSTSPPNDSAPPRAPAGKRRPRAKPTLPHATFDAQSKDGIWEGLVRIQRVEWKTGKIRYRVDRWDREPPLPWGWTKDRWCDWLLGALIYSHFLHKRLRKQRERHGDPSSMKTIIS